MILIENPLASKAGWENDMSIAAMESNDPVDSMNSQFDEP
jgi:hypothetical protein